MTDRSFAGVGEVLDAGKHVCTVRYRLQQRETSSSHISLTGDITVDETEVLTAELRNTLESGQVFTLRLEDKHELKVSFNRKDPISGVWRVVAAPGNTPLD